MGGQFQRVLHLLDSVFSNIYSIFNSNLYLLIVFYIEIRTQQLIERIEQFVIELKQQLFYLKVHWRKKAAAITQMICSNVSWHK